eukprot:2187089-Rhodomonas_salina.1
MVLCDARYWRTISTQRHVALRPRHAMCGTTLAYAAISLRTCYAMSGTEMLYTAISLRVRYAMSGTEIAYTADSALSVSPQHARCPLSAYALATRYP